ncbi:MAG: hypothetical protein K1X71_04845 [Pirellulales bacterium]|nr:hypothetical protein [Pirellulales bacterium]
MSRSPRLAVGAVQSDADSHWITWALLGAFKRRQLEVQHFFGDSSLAALSAAATITGAGSRHLDSWLMSPGLCRELYERSTTGMDLAVIEGRFHGGCKTQNEAASLELLCDWLDLPKIAVIDVERVDGCRLPILPHGADALLLDRVAGARSLVRHQTVLESRYGIPVLGALPPLRAARQSIARAPHGSPPSQGMCNELGAVLERHAQLDRLLEIAERGYPHRLPCGFSNCRCQGSGRRIAIAYDAAFNSYFQDALDQLEAAGAELVTFSPLNDERLPAGCDIVYLGGGQPELFADRLAANQCMLASLRDHYRAGRRMYAEGGGLAYLCQSILDVRGARHAMAAIVPAVAHFQSDAASGVPIEATLARSSWLADAGSRLRGYTSGRWRLEADAEMESCLLEPGFRSLALAMRGLVGSLIHANFAAQPSLLGRFLAPWPPVAAPTVC